MTEDERVEAWLGRAERDLEAATVLLESGFFDYSIFWSQQAAEKAVKALYIRKHGNLAPKTHRVDILAQGFGAPEEMVNRAANLVAEYIATRYPEPVLPLPSAFYTKEIALQRIDDAQAIIQWVKGEMSGG